MGSSISKLYDDYDDYKYLCKFVGVKLLDMDDEWMNHEDEILILNGVRSKYDLYPLSNPCGIEWIDIMKRDRREVVLDKILS